MIIFLSFVNIDSYAEVEYYLYQISNWVAVHYTTKKHKMNGTRWCELLEKGREEGENENREAVFSNMLSL